MKIETSHKLILTNEEVIEAVREYVALHSAGEKQIGETSAVYADTGEGAVQGFKIEVHWDD